MLGVMLASFVGVDCELSARDFRDEDRGVMFEFTKFVTGVILSPELDLVAEIEGVVVMGGLLVCGDGVLYPASFGAGEDRGA